MTQSLTDAQKRKRVPSRQWGCLKLLLISILLSLACYGGMWVFARYGGEWATDSRVLLPPESHLMSVSYREDDFKSSLYFYTGTVETLKTWDFFSDSRSPAYDLYSVVLRYIYPNITDPLD
jgi:hypothetical protein